MEVFAKISNKALMGLFLVTSLIFNSQANASGRAPKKGKSRRSKAGVQFPGGKSDPRARAKLARELARNGVRNVKTIGAGVSPFKDKALNALEQAVLEFAKGEMERKKANASLAKAISGFVEGIAIGGKITQKEAESFIKSLVEMRGNPQDPGPIDIKSFKDVIGRIVNAMVVRGGDKLEAGTYRGRKMQSLYKQFNELNKQLADTDQDAPLKKVVITPAEASQVVKDLAANPQDVQDAFNDEATDLNREGLSVEEVTKQVQAGAAGNPSYFRRFVKFTLRHKWKIAGAIALSAVVGVGAYYFVVAKTTATATAPAVHSIISYNATTPAVAPVFGTCPMGPLVAPGFCDVSRAVVPYVAPTLCEATPAACAVVVHKAPAVMVPAVKALPLGLPAAAGTRYAFSVRPGVPVDSGVAVYDGSRALAVVERVVPTGTCAAPGFTFAPAVPECDPGLASASAAPTVTVEPAVEPNWASHVAERVERSADELRYCPTGAGGSVAESIAIKVNCAARAVGNLLGLG